MTAPDRPLDFAELRRIAIGHAQAASGQVWTDYNLHDPGVTLLEQTCFALSQIAYQADFPIRDLLTDEGSRFAVGPERRLYDPVQALRSAPVTRDDLDAVLSDLPGVARAWVDAVSPDGHLDVTVVPAADDPSPDTLIAEVERGFARIRPLCTALRRVTVARCRRVVLSARVAISATALPERVAGGLYHAVSAILRGMPIDGAMNGGATRADVYGDPIALLRSPDQIVASRPDLDSHLHLLRRIPGLESLSDLALSPLDGETETGPTFLAVVLPATDAEVALDLTLNGTPVTVEAAAIREEVARLSAERIAGAKHHVLEVDFDVLRPGTARDFDAAPVDALLPRIYGTGQELAGYRAAIDGHLADLSADLSALPRTMAARTDPDLDDPEAHRRRVALFDYRLALQGEVLPAVRNTGLHRYRTVRERQAFDLFWRQRVLNTLADMNAARGVAPGGRPPGGFVARLSLRTDLRPGDGALAAPLAAYGLTLDQGASLPDGAAATICPQDVFDMLVPVDPAARPFDPDAFRALWTWPGGDTLTPETFDRAAEPDSFFLSDHADGTTRLLFEPSADGALVEVARFEARAAVLEALHRLRATWRHLHEASEGLYLIEDIDFAALDLPVRPHVATLLLTGWTARTRLPAYRSYVTDQVARLAPAHVRVDLRWLDHSEMVAFERLHRAGPSAELQAFLRALGDGS